MNKALLLTILLVLTSCNRNTDSTSGIGKSRSELLAEIPYRGEIVSKEITKSISETLKLVLKQIKSLNDVKVYYVTQKGELKKQKGNWENGTSALKLANELWRYIDLTMTIVVYPSFSQDAVTGETKKLWVIEIDHKNVSRTCRMFFDTPTPNKLTDLVN